MKRKEVDAITKHAYELVELSKGSALQNVTTAVANGSVKVSRTELPRLIYIIQSSIEQGFAVGVQEFETQVETTLASHAAKKK